MDTKLVIEFLTKLGEQISTTGKEVFEVYTRQAYYSGVMDLILGIALIITTALFLKGSIWAYKRDKDDGWLICFNVLSFL